ncbi:hypothetical protein Pmani_031371 [Petrolisthes manimaculis]|uniref:Uncharacterized protein n=1 Tax=Petrolisthes manimaculis TaxID=1843537 RepID=A0AAE1NTV1_9EUCA|nr:hypothetical protein Pmani_031371 [Petrolisthes manimaculis]
MVRTDHQSEKDKRLLWNIDVRTWEDCAEDRSDRRLTLTVRRGTQKAEEARNTALAQKKARRRERQEQPQQSSSFECRICSY